MSKSTVAITISVPTRLLRWAETELKHDDETRSGWITRVIREAFEASVAARESPVEESSEQAAWDRAARESMRAAR